MGTLDPERQYSQLRRYVLLERMFGRFFQELYDVLEDALFALPDRGDLYDTRRGIEIALEMIETVLPEVREGEGG